MSYSQDYMPEFNSDDYRIRYNVLGPNGWLMAVLVDRKNWKSGYIYTRRYAAQDESTKKYYYDDEFFAPYVISKIGKKVGIDTPETELRGISYVNQDKRSLMESFTQSSIVYDDALGYLAHPLQSSQGRSYKHQDYVWEEYLENNYSGDETKRRKMNPGLGIQRMLIDDYINANIYYLTMHGSKSRQEYSKTEIDHMKQQLIERALFGLRFGIHGVFNIVLEDGSNARLGPYFLASDNMFFLGDPERGGRKQLEMTDEEFKKLLNRKYKPQYYLFPGQDIESLTSRDVIEYIYEHYPQQALKAYEKLSRCTEDELEKILGECEEMSELHRRLALREFRMRGQEFNQIHQQHIKTQEPDIEK